MARNSGKTSHEASLKQRQLNGINKIASSRRDAPNNRTQRPNGNMQDGKGKSLLDRMTAPPATNSTDDTRDPFNASPRKRKRQKSKSRDAGQVEEESEDPPAKRTKPEETKTPADPATAQVARKILPWQNIKTKKQPPVAASSKQDAAESSSSNPRTPAPSSGQPKAPTSSSSMKTKAKDTIGFTPQPPTKPDSKKTSASNTNDNKDGYPSPPSEQPGSALNKRGADEIYGPEQASKKSRFSYVNKTMQPVDAATAAKRQAYLKPSAPAVANPDCEHTYRAWGDNNVPLLFSLHARDGRQDVLLNNPSLDLQCRAIALLESPNGYAPNDLGRPNVPKKGRSKIIDDLDLYLMDDYKVYVATEDGLLLAADYLKLAGIPDSTPVRFNGIKPAYVKAHPLTRFCRFVSVTTYDPSAHESERARLGPGELPLLYNEMVEIWALEPQPKGGIRAFGRLIHDNQTGWFDLKNTVASRKELPPIEDALEPIYTQGDYLFSRNDSPADPVQIASLKYVKTYVPQRYPHPVETATAPPATTPPKTPQSNAATPSKSAQPAGKEAPKEAKADAQIPAPPKDNEATPKGEPSPEVTKIETEKIAHDDKKVVETVVKKYAQEVIKDRVDTAAQDAISAPAGRDNIISADIDSKKHDIEKEETAASNTSNNSGPVRLSLHAYCDEDDVDWGDEEL